jgi:hypothetical protein
MPIDVSVDMASSDSVFVVRDSLATQNWTLHVPNEPLNVRLDKLNGGWILRGMQANVVDPTFDRGILVVNGVSWSSYGSEITSAYEDSVFWGSLDFSFWDLFPAPSGGYPSTLPTPLGTNSGVPSDSLKQFSTVVWVGNNYGGDLLRWVNTSILDYLQAGGNVVLLTRMGQAFVNSGLADYLGITWAGDTDNTLSNCVSRHPDLVDMPFTGTQSFNALFDSTFSQTETELLFVSNSSGGKHASGAWRAPAAGGSRFFRGGRTGWTTTRCARTSRPFSAIS